jgi:glycosyltransferase involved in cell wall biosynthesis
MSRIVAAPTVSVALCTYNGERFIERQLASILTQTSAVDEIVVSDDASRDATATIVQGIASAASGRGPRVRLLQNAEPLGVSGNFERAIQATTGDLIALSDQDDRWHPDRIERLLRVFDRHPETSLVHSDARLVDADDRSIGGNLLDSLDVTDRERAEIFAGGAFNTFLRRNLVTGATTIFRRELAEIALPVPEGWIHDEWLAIVAAATGRVRLLDQPLTDYRQHGQNLIGAAKLDFRGRFERLREQGAERNDLLLVRAESLAERFGEGRPPVPPAMAIAARAKAGHERMRSGLSRSRFRRVGPIVREWGAGGYDRFGRGWIDIVRDLIQPL